MVVGWVDVDDCRERARGLSSVACVCPLLLPPIDQAPPFFSIHPFDRSTTDRLRPPAVPHTHAHQHTYPRGGSCCNEEEAAAAAAAGRGGGGRGCCCSCARSQEHPAKGKAPPLAVAACLGLWLGCDGGGGDTDDTDVVCPPRCFRELKCLQMLWAACVRTRADGSRTGTSSPRRACSAGCAAVGPPVVGAWSVGWW
jgi:hypothetical protein